MPISLGDHIGDYEVTGTLGAGGIGCVYKVRHSISHRTEAMKVLLPDRPGSEEVGERFLREIRVLASLDHPNIATLHTAFRHDGELIMILEFVEGMTLRARLISGPLLMSQSLEIICQVLMGLAYAHGKGVVHRDIKPSNIMITRQERVKLLDFGLAFQGRASQITRTGLILGSLLYMSPEQVLGERIDARSDIYSVGVTLYQLLTGKTPIDGSGEYAIASAHLHETPVEPSRLNANIPVALSRAVMKALEKDQEARFQTAGEFLDLLTSIQASLNPEETMTRLPAPALSREVSSSRERNPEARTNANRTSKTLSGATILSSITRELAQYIGPIAKVVVNRAAKQSVTLDELYSLIATEVHSDQQRKAFLETRRKYSIEDQI
jgi:serine/threonine protein kinase